MARRYCSALHIRHCACAIMHKSIIAIILGLLLAPAGALRADLFVLSTGGNISGELVNRDESPRRSYVIRTPEGGQVTIHSDQIKQIIPQSAAELEYEKVRPTYPDTVQGQWELAQWCRERGLVKERKVHLERIVELDPNHLDARRALGHNNYDGVWMTLEQWKQKQGYVRYGGRWLLPQEVELAEKERSNELAAKEWMRSLSRLRGMLDQGGAKMAQAREEILEIDEPAAVPAIRAALKDEKVRAVKLLYIQALRQIGTPAAFKALVDLSLMDADEEVRLSCLDLLQEGDHPDAVSRYVAALKSKENYMVTRAAIGLRRLNDTSAIEPLINALMTTHRVKIAPANPGQMSSTFGSDGSIGFSAGGSKGTIQTQKVWNQPVLEALIQLTGQNFDFNIAAWKRWYAAQKTSGDIDFRRD